MPHPICSATISFVLGLVPVLAAAQEVNYDVDRTKNFAEVRTFAMKEEPKSDNPLVDRRISAAINAELLARGLRQINDDPDVYIIPKMTVEKRKEVTSYTGYWPYYGSYTGSWYMGAGWGTGWGAGWGPTIYDVRELQYNTMVVDMVDAKTGMLLWRGTGVKRVHSHWKPETVDRKVQKTVAKIMSNLPATSSFASGARISP